MSVTNYVDGPLGGTPLNAANLNRDFNNRPAKWQPNTPYIGGGVDLCITPNGDVGSRITSGTSPSTFAADAANWALSTTYGFSNPTLTVTYNTDGSVASVVENGVTTSFTYNTDGTVNTQTRAGVTRTFTYDANGNVTGAS